MNARDTTRDPTRQTSGLSPAQEERLGDRLRQEEALLTRRLAERRKALAVPALREPDDADWAAGSADQSLLVRLVDRDSKLLLEVRHALRKLADGALFGLCERSGEPIGFERLWVRPWTRYAVAPKEEVERARRAGGDDPTVLTG